MNLRRGTDLGFTDLVNSEHRSATAAAAMIVGDVRVAEEIAQDVFERAYERWSKVSALDRPGAWIRRAVINQSISATRRTRSERRALARLVRRDAIDLTATTSNGSTSEVTPGSSFELWSAVRDLPANQATAVALHYGADLSIETVGEEMGLSTAAVKSLLYRAREELRQHTEFKEVAQ